MVQIWLYTKRNGITHLGGDNYVDNYCRNRLFADGYRGILWGLCLGNPQAQRNGQNKMSA